MLGENQDQLDSAISFKEFAAILRRLTPDQVGELWAKGRADQRPYWRQVNYQAAMIDRLYQIGFLATALDEQQRKSCREFAEAVAQHVRTWHIPPRQQTWLDASINASLKYYSFHGSAENTRGYLFLNGMIDEYGAKVEKTEAAE